MIGELIGNKQHTFDHIHSFLIDDEDEKIVHIYDYDKNEIKLDQVKPGMFIYLHIMDSYDGETCIWEIIVQTIDNESIDGQVLCRYPVYDLHKYVEGKGFVKVASSVDQPEECIAEDPNKPNENEVTDGDLVMITYAENKHIPDDENWDDPLGLYLVAIHPEDIDIFDPDLNVRPSSQDDEYDDDDEEDGLNELSFVSATKYLTFIGGYEEYATKFRPILDKAIQEYNEDIGDDE